MTTEQQQAYDWAKGQDYPSVAARYAKALAYAVDDLQAQLSESQRSEKAAAEECDTLMRRYGKQVEVIRRRIDAGVLTAEEQKLLDDLVLPRHYDRRDPGADGR